MLIAQDKAERAKEPLTVVLRVRPFTPTEVRAGESNPCIVPESDGAVVIRKPATGISERFNFSTVLGPEVTQQSLFQRTVAPFVLSFLRGTPALIFAYGVTNAGKTYTVLGTNGEPGLVPRLIDVVLCALHRHSPDSFQAPSQPPPATSAPAPRPPVRANKLAASVHGDLEYSVSEVSYSAPSSDAGSSSSSSSSPTATEAMATAAGEALDPASSYALFASYLEVYNENVYDLLVDAPPGKGPVRREPLQIAGDGRTPTTVRGLRMVQVSCAADAQRVVEQGVRNRTSADTTLNSESSRSHAVLTFYLAQYPRGSSLAALEAQQPHAVRYHRIAIVDLAGSERASRTNNTGEQLSEASNINNSLLTFRRCVEKLRWNQRNPRSEQLVPFRDSKLTRLFQDYFVGNGRAMMVVNVSPTNADYAETHHVLNFSTLARELCTTAAPDTVRKGKRPQIDLKTLEELKDAPKDVLIAEISQLRQQVADSETDRIIAELELRSEMVAEMRELISDHGDIMARRCNAEIDTVESCCDRKVSIVAKFEDERYRALQADFKQVQEAFVGVERNCKETILQLKLEKARDTKLAEGTGDELRKMVLELQAKNRELSEDYESAKLRLQEDAAAEVRKAREHFEGEIAAIRVKFEANASEETRALRAELQREKHERDAEHQSFQSRIIQLGAKLDEATKSTPTHSAGDDVVFRADSPVIVDVVGPALVAAAAAAAAPPPQTPQRKAPKTPAPKTPAPQLPPPVVAVSPKTPREPDTLPFLHSRSSPLFWIFRRTHTVKDLPRLLGKETEPKEIEGERGNHGELWKEEEGAEEKEERRPRRGPCSRTEQRRGERERG